MLLAVKFVIGILDLRDSQKSSHLSRSKVSELSQEQQGVLNVGSGMGAAGQGRGDSTGCAKTALLSGCTGRGAGVRAQRPSQVKDDETWGAVEPERGIKSKTDLLRVKRSWDWPGGVGWGGVWIERGKRGNNGARLVPEQSSGG